MNTPSSLNLSPFADTPLRKAILRALHEPTLENVEDIAREALREPLLARREILPTPHQALNWFVQQAGHEPTCNIHTNERPNTGCSCRFGPAYAVLSDIVYQRKS